MMLLDTNVLSGLMRDPADQALIAWLDRQAADEVWTSAVNVFEVRFGLNLLPAGRRRQTLEQAFEDLLRVDLAARIMPLDAAGAAAAGEIAAVRKRSGRPVDFRDTLIAGIATSRRAIVATRNVRHFADLPSGCINPWEFV